MAILMLVLLIKRWRVTLIHCSSRCLWLQSSGTSCMNGSTMEQWKKPWEAFLFNSRSCSLFYKQRISIPWKREIWPLVLDGKEVTVCFTWFLLTLMIIEFSCFSLWTTRCTRTFTCDVRSIGTQISEEWTTSNFHRKSLQGNNGGCYKMSWL